MAGEGPRKPTSSEVFCLGYEISTAVGSRRTALSDDGEGQSSLGDVEAAWNSAANTPKAQPLSPWKVAEEKRWEDWSLERDTRLQTIEQITLVAIFLAAFAVSDLSGYNAKDFTYPWGEIFLCLMCNVVGCTTFLAVVGTLTISTVHRESEWDKSLAQWVKRSTCRTYDDAVATLQSCVTYRLATTQLWKLAYFNSTESSRTRYTEASMAEERSLGLPFSTRTLNIMADFNTTPLGFTRAAFPTAVMCYLVAIAVKFSQRASSAIIILPVVFLLTWGFAISYYSRNLLKILGHVGEGIWMNELR